MDDDLKRLLRRTARAAEDRSILLAATFALYREAERIDTVELARRLGIAPERLDELALCGRPRREQFGEDARAIAARVGADPGALANVIRQVDALAAFAETAPRNLLAAARDAEDETRGEEEP